MSEPRLLRQEVPSRRLTLRTTLGWFLLFVLLSAVAWKATTEPIDFPIYYKAGTQVLAGDFELYPSGVYQDGQTVEGHGFRYAPILAILFAPWSLLPMPVSVLIFFLAKIAAISHMLGILCRRLNLESRRGAVIGIALVTTGGYILEELRGGNLQFFIVYLVVVAFDRSERSRIWTPVLSLAVSITAKLTPTLVLGYLLLRRRFAIVALVIAVVVLLLLLPAVLWGTEQNWRLLQGFVRYSSTALDGGGRNYSMRGLLSGLGMSPGAVTSTWILLSAAAAGALLRLQWLPPSPLAAEIQFAITLALIPVLSPHSQRIYFVWLTVPAIVLFAVLHHNLLTDVYKKIAVASLVAVSAISTVGPLILTSRALALAYMQWSPYTYSALIIVVALFAIAFSQAVPQSNQAPSSRHPVHDGYLAKPS